MTDLILRWLGIRTAWTGQLPLPRQKWDYDVVKLERSLWDDRWSLSLLDGRGDAGWELAGIIPPLQKGDVPVAVFKRPR